ncbi:uncharacterized protein LOC142544813 [Primulina tabacum]|uniref:uncharacterized protein LOC142544813 n=1 Tax=Primulina tabacum TaxID=48773 RepID=UPI003F5A2418
MGLSHDNPRTIFSSLQEDLDQRPLMLKDFLKDDCSHSCSSSSSPIGSDRWNPIKVSGKSNNPLNVQLLSRSKSAAMHTISALHKVVNLVKIIPFASGGKGKNDISRDSPKVKVKDILRWTSFKDLDVGKSTPLDNLTSISASRSSSTSSSRSSSSWSQSDLTADDLPCCCSENNAYFNNISDDMLRKIPKEEWPFEESDQQSPTSVLHDSLFLESETPVSPCHTSVSNNVAEGRKHVLMRRIQEQEVGKSGSLEGERVADEVEEKAKRLQSQVMETDGEARDDHLILDFFEHELSTFGKLDDLGFNSKILEVAKSWKNGECEELFEWELLDKRDAFVRDMEREVGWTKFGCEEEEMCKELQIEVWSELLSEVLNDFHAK